MSENKIQIDPALLTKDDLGKLGLSGHPFLEHADDAYLYSDSQLEMTSNIIMEYLTNPATTIVLTGEDGVGKTTFLRKILRLGYQQYQFCTLRVNEDTDFEFIEDKIKQRWVLADTNEHSSVADLSFENYVITYLRGHVHAVLIIDDAHHLDSSALDKLFTLKHRVGLACPLGLGLILAGENTLKLSLSELEDSNPACTQVYQINVRPFSKDQTERYIEHRLHAAGLENEILLDEVNTTEIYKITLGNIRQIHQKTIVALQNQCRESSVTEALGPHITIRDPKHKYKVPVFLISILAIIGIGLYASYYYMGNKNSDEIIIALEKPLASEPPLSPIAQGSNNLPSEQTPSRPLLNAPNTLDITEITIPQITVHKEASNEDSLLSESIEVLDGKQLETLKEKLVEKVEVAETQIPDSLKTVAKPNVINEKSQPLSRSAPSTKGESWLKELDPESYTLQVVAAQESKQLEALVKRINLKDNYAYFDKQVKGSTFYVLVIGNYKSRDSALSAVNQLPESLKKNKPWPIPLKNIQKHLH